MDKLLEQLDKREPIFICVGTMRSKLDSVAPRLGTKLEKIGYKVIGTEDNPFHARNMLERIENEINIIDKTKYQEIYIDAQIRTDNEEIYVSKIPLKPRGGLNQAICSLGGWFIGLNIYKGYNSYAEFYYNLLSNENVNEEYLNKLIEDTYKLILEALERSKANEKAV